MKLVVTLYFFRLGNSEGGAERRLLQLANDLNLRGHCVHVISWDECNAQAFHHIAPNVQWHRLGFRSGVLDKLRRTFVLYKLLLTIKTDVFVGFVMSADKTVYIANLLARVPIVAAERNSPKMYEVKFSNWTRFAYMLLFLLARKVVVQFENYRIGYPPWLNSRLDVIPNPVNKTSMKCSPEVKGVGGWIVLCVARLEDQKNIECLIRAFSLIASDFIDWSLRIVGEGAQRSSLEKLAEDLGCQDRIKMPGAIKEIDIEYQSAHLFCLPSIWEGFPNALAEAMAHGLPSIGFAECPGVNSLISHGQNGLLAPGINNPETLSEAMRMLMTDQNKRLLMGTVASRLTDCYQPERITDMWENLLSKTVGIKRKC